MSLGRQFEIKTGKSVFSEHGELCYSEDYVDFLIEKQTWKKFSEKTPDDYRKIICREADSYGEYTYFNYDENTLQSARNAKEFIEKVEWIDAPD